MPCLLGDNPPLNLPAKFLKLANDQSNISSFLILLVVPFGLESNLLLNIGLLKTKAGDFAKGIIKGFFLSISETLIGFIFCFGKILIFAGGFFLVFFVLVFGLGFGGAGVKLLGSKSFHLVGVVIKFFTGLVSVFFTVEINFLAVGF